MTDKTSLPGAADPQRFCNKCGYFGPDQEHQRPNGTGECYYFSSPLPAEQAATQAEAPDGEVISTNHDYSTVRWLKPNGDPNNAWSWPTGGTKVYLAAPTAPTGAQAEPVADLVKLARACGGYELDTVAEWTVMTPQDLANFAKALAEQAAPKTEPLTDAEIDALLPQNQYGGSALTHFNHKQVREVVRAALTAPKAEPPILRELTDALRDRIDFKSDIKVADLIRRAETLLAGHQGGDSNGQ